MSKKTKKSRPISYTNRQVQPDGTSTQYRLVATDAGSTLTIERDGQPSESRDLGPLVGGVREALALVPELLVVGTGFTDITCGSGISVHDLLGMLVVADPDVDPPSAEDWLDADGHPVAELGIDVEDWAYDEEILGIRTDDDCEIVPRWIRIDDDRGFLVRGREGFAAVGLLDPEREWNWPDITDELLSWRFYGESGGPCTWDGGADLGWCGPKLWAFRRRGDYEPDQLVVPAPSETEIAEAVAGWILQLDWELPYLLSAVGLPGLTKEDRAAFGEVQDSEGQDVDSRLGKELDGQVVALLCAAYPELGTAVEGLRDPESERGKLIYAWLRQMIHGPYQSGSWNQVHSALLGQIAPPADDQRAPTMAERWQASLDRATAAIEEAYSSDGETGRSGPDA